MSRIAFIDVAHLLYSSWHASADQPLTACFDYTVSKVLQIVQQPRFDKVVVCWDHAPYKRQTIDPQYKAHRERPDPGLVENRDRVMAKLEKLGVHQWRAQGYEADDLIATGVRHAEADGMEVEIYSGDKDLLALVTIDVAVISTRTGDLYGPDEVKDKFGVAPKLIPDWLSLVGDKSDNIPGCPNVGPKNATKLLNKYGSLEAVLAAEDIGGRTGGNIAENRERILRSAALVELLTDAPVVWGDLWTDAPAGAERPASEPPPLPEEAMFVEEEELEEVGYEDDERAAIEAEAEEAEAEASAPVEVVVEQPAAEPPTGDKLVGGAIARQRGPALAKAPARPPAKPVTDLDKPLPAAAIELRPGVHMTSAQFGLMVKMAGYFHESGLYMRKFESEAAIFTVMELGLELGISPQIALQNFHMIEGKPSPAAHFLIGLAKKDPDCIYLECVEEGPGGCTYETAKHSMGGKPLRFTYTLEDAQQDQMRWAKRGAKNQRAMCRKTAGAQAARLWYPEATSGLYANEELGYDMEQQVA